MSVRALLSDFQHDGSSSLGETPPRRTRMQSRYGARKSLAHLVSKFENLDNLARQGKSSTKGNLRATNASPSPAKLTCRPPSAASSISGLSLSTATNTPSNRAKSLDHPTELRVDIAAATLHKQRSDQACPVNTVVAERRRLFEGDGNETKTGQSCLIPTAKLYRQCNAL